MGCRAGPSSRRGHAGRGPADRLALLYWLPWTPFCLSSGHLGGVDFSTALSDERENLSGEVTLQGSNDVEFGMPFRDPTSNIGLGSLSRVTGIGEAKPHREAFPGGRQRRK